MLEKTAFLVLLGLAAPVAAQTAPAESTRDEAPAEVSEAPQDGSYPGEDSCPPSHAAELARAQSQITAQKAYIRALEQQAESLRHQIAVLQGGH